MRENPKQRIILVHLGALLASLMLEVLLCEQGFSLNTSFFSLQHSDSSSAASKWLQLVV